MHARDRVDLDIGGERTRCSRGRHKRDRPGVQILRVWKSV